MHDANIFVPGCSYEHAARPGAWPWPGMGSLKSDWLHSPLSHLQGAVKLLHHCSNVIPMVMMNFGFKESCQLLHACCTFYTIRPDPVICEQPPASRQLTADKLVTTPAPAQHSTAQQSLPPHNNSTFLRFAGHRLGRAVLSVAACCDQVIMAAPPSSSYQREAQDRMCHCNFQ